MVAVKKQGVGAKHTGPRSHLKKYWPYYVMLLPGVIYIVMFKYIPMMGSVIAFKDYSAYQGILDSPWCGLENFKKLFQYPDFYKILGNTLILGALKTFLTFPIPVILALMLNEIRNAKVKKVVQTIICIPYFVSWVVVGGLVFDICGVGGLFNNVRDFFGMEPLLVMQKESWFRPIYVLSTIWKESGWGTVVYLAAISSIDPSLYESAAIDVKIPENALYYVSTFDSDDLDAASSEYRKLPDTGIRSGIQPVHTDDICSGRHF